MSQISIRNRINTIETTVQSLTPLIKFKVNRSIKSYLYRLEYFFSYYTVWLDGTDTDIEANYLCDLIEEIIAYFLAGLDLGGGGSVTPSDCGLIAQFGMDGSQNVTNAEQVLSLDNDVITSTNIVRSGGRLTFDKDATLIVDVSIYMELDANDGARSTLKTFLRKNGVGEIPFAFGDTYARGVNYTDSGVANIASTVIEVVAGDFIEVIFDDNEDIQTPTVGHSRTWILLREYCSGSGSGGGELYTNANPTPATVGGISSGSTFFNQTMTQMLDALLYPYQAPAFTSFSVTGSNTLECGNTLPANQTANWVTSNSVNVNTNSISINNTTPLTSLVSGSSNDGSEPLVQGAITNNVPSVNSWNIIGTNSKGASFSRTHTKRWYWAMYYGESATNINLVENEVEGLRVKLLTGSFSRTYSFLAGSTYKFIAYPESLGTATTFTDVGTGFAVAMEAPYIIPVTNAFGQTTNYRVHRTTNILNGAINIAVS